MQNLNKAIRIAEQEHVDYEEKINGMLEAYRATPHPSTSKSPYKLMFGRNMNLNIFPTMKRKVRDGAIRNRDRQYKEKAKEYHDRKKNVKESRIRLGDRVLLKDRRTDRLKPEVGIVVGIRGHAVTPQFGNGRIFKRDKSHLKVVNRAVVPFSRETPMKEVRVVEQLRKRFEPSDTDESDIDESHIVNVVSGSNPALNLVDHVQRTRSGRETRKPETFGEWTD